MEYRRGREPGPHAMKERHTKHAGEKPHGPRAAEAKARAAGDEPAPAGARTVPAEELDRLNDRLLRLQADFENYRKRALREKNELCERAGEELIQQLLPVIDHFELGLNTAVSHHADQAIMSGFQIVYDQLMNILGRNGVTPIEAEGQPFNPHLHEAVSHIPSEEHPADTVVAQTRRGYLLRDRLLRAAQVVVSSGPSPVPPEDETERTD